MLIFPMPPAPFPPFIFTRNRTVVELFGIDSAAGVIRNEEKNQSEDNTINTMQEVQSIVRKRLLGSFADARVTELFSRELCLNECKDISRLEHCRGRR
jgi:hypothetical protein